MSPRSPRRGIAAVALVTAALALIGAAGTWAAFTATTANSGNSFSAAATFTSGTAKFASGTYTGNDVDNRAITGLGFKPDVVIIKGDNPEKAVTRTATMPGDAAKPMVTKLAVAADLIQSLDADGFTLGRGKPVNDNGKTYHWIALRAGAGSIKVGTYLGNGTAQSITGAGFSPEYVMVLPDHKFEANQRFTGMTRGFRFDADTGTTTRITSLDGDGFSVGTDDEVNKASNLYHYIAVNDVASSIDVGSYTGNGADSRTVSGVGFTPDSVIVRSGDTATGRQAVARPSSIAGDSSFRFDGANAANNVQNLLADGFEVGTDSAVNANGAPYHYVAFGTPPAGTGLQYGGTGPVAGRTSSGSLTVNYPAGVAANDQLFLVEVNAANQAITTPAGWTLVADQATGTPAQLRFTVWSKLRAAESSVNLSVNTNSSGTSAWVARYYNPAGYPPNPVSAATVRQGVAGAATTLTPSPDLTTTAADATAISIVATRAANALSLSTAQGFTTQLATTNSPNQGVALAIADRPVPVSGTTPPSPTWTQSGTAAQWAWASVAYR